VGTLPYFREEKNPTNVGQFSIYARTFGFGLGIYIL